MESKKLNYRRLKKQHELFAEYVSGIDDTEDKHWYVSVMMNRLIFCYFIQKKNFFDFNSNFLGDKLAQYKQDQKNKAGNSFYKSFLLLFFHNRLNDYHQLEKKYSNIDIEDKAFEKLFKFFDKYKWQLDIQSELESQSESDEKIITPDVFSYIFEQYINDRSHMGAYYTKEDITNYISKNCILPFLLKDSIRRYGDDTSFIWDFLKTSSDCYIYDSVKKGVNLPLPENIAKGLDTAKPNLLERRKDWNLPADEEYALPTENWREVIERRTRYNEIKTKIQNGEITHINDFVIYNLNITSFIYDFLNDEIVANKRFISCFYDSLKNISILDPTCGSGAFLFAAFYILEPLYEICIPRLPILKDEIKRNYRSNIKYFIYKNIILHNLYGKDIMKEATEIAKLQLFLKLMSVVDADKNLPNNGLEYISDIDFNITCENFLLGSATEPKSPGKFDVIIGNPPYCEYSNKNPKTKRAVSDDYKIQGYKTLSCGNLYAYVMERSKSLLSENGYIGMIVPLSGHSTERMKPLVTEFYEKFSFHLHYNLSADANPQILFEGVKFRLAIFFASNKGTGRYSTKYTRWFSEERPYLFTSLIKYNNIEDYKYNNIIPKVSSPLFLSIARKMEKENLFFKNEGVFYCLYYDAPINWIRAHTFEPYFYSERDGQKTSSHLQKIFFNSEIEKECGCAVLNSSIFFIWWITHSSCYNLNTSELSSFRLSLNEKEKVELCELNIELTKDVLANSIRKTYKYKTTGKVEYDEFYMKKSKSIIDKIDILLAQHYNFTQEELDYIINYDIKYRMGKTSDE